MSNLDIVMNFIKVEPDFDKKDMIEKIMRTLNTSKTNAQAYLYNAQKKLGKPSVKQVKQENAVKSAADLVKTRKVNADRRAVIDAEVRINMAKIEADMAEFEKNYKFHKNNILLVPVD